MAAPHERDRAFADLAVAGGTPAFAEALHVGRPNVGDVDVVLAGIRDVLQRRWLTNDGPMVRAFEERMCEVLGVRNAVAVCNGTVAIEILAKALGLTGEVIVPAFTFVATAHALAWMGLKPVFCDIDPLTHNIDPVAAERLIGPNTSAILGVHVWGRPCPTDELVRLADSRGLRLVFDAAHGFGASHDGRMIGTFGDAETFSFHATKFVNAFEGGAITTDDDELAQRCRLMRNFGFVQFDAVASMGTNGKMSEASAVMALESLRQMDSYVDVNAANHARYVEGLASVPGLNVVRYSADERCNYQYVVVEVDAAFCGLTRDQVLAVLKMENVLARRYFYPGCHRLEPYREEWGSDDVAPCTDRLAERVLVLPTGTAISAADVDGICAVIRCAVAHAEQVVEALERLGA